MSSKFTTAREQMKTALEAFAPLAGASVFVERDGEDIDEPVEVALNTSGLAIIILSTTAGVIDQVMSGGTVVMRATVPVCILENVVRNMADADEAAQLPAGSKISSELALQHVIRALIGREIGDGNATLAKDCFARGGDDAGLIEHYVGIDVPITMRGA